MLLLNRHPRRYSLNPHYPTPVFPQRREPGAGAPRRSEARRAGGLLSTSIHARRQWQNRQNALSFSLGGAVLVWYTAGVV